MTVHKRADLSCERSDVFAFAYCCMVWCFLGHANCPPSRKHRWQTSIFVWCWCQHQMGGSCLIVGTKTGLFGGSQTRFFHFHLLNPVPISWIEGVISEEKHM